MKFSKIIFFVLLFSLSGCGGSNYLIKPEWDKSKLVTVNVYRTKTAFHSLNPEKPFFYIDGEQFAKLGTNSAITIKALPGKHTITVKEPFMFMPGYENARLEVNFEESKEYYIRYSKEASIIYGNGMITGESTIHIVNKEYYQQRK